ncbi:MAG: RNA polymerase sigma factor [Marinoscillum sp.]
MHNREDTDLINDILGGDSRAFADLVDKYQRRVYNFVVYTLRNQEDADEVAQDTFVKAYKGLSTFRGDSKFSTWLLRIAYNTCMTRLRKVKPGMVDLVASGIDLDGGNNILEQSDLEDMRSVLARAMAQLNQGDQALVTLYYYNEQSIKEICEITSESESKIKVDLHRCRKKLLKILNQMGIKEWVS